MNAITELKPKRTWREGKKKLLAQIADLRMQRDLAEAERNDADARCFQHKLDVLDARLSRDESVRRCRRFAGWYAAASFAFGVLLGVAL